MATVGSLAERGVPGPIRCYRTEFWFVGVGCGDVGDPGVLLPGGGVELGPEWRVRADEAVEPQGAEEQVGFEGVIPYVGDSADTGGLQLRHTGHLDEEVGDDGGPNAVGHSEVRRRWEGSATEKVDVARAWWDDRAMQGSHRGRISHAAPGEAEEGGARLVVPARIGGEVVGEWAGDLVVGSRDEVL